MALFSMDVPDRCNLVLSIRSNTRTLNRPTTAKYIQLRTGLNLGKQCLWEVHAELYCPFAMERILRTKRINF